ncbi:peptidase C14B family protein [Abortiporus biennis]
MWHIPQPQTGNPNYEPQYSYSYSSQEYGPSTGFPEPLPGPNAPAPFAPIGAPTTQYQYPSMPGPPPPGLPAAPYGSQPAVIAPRSNFFHSSSHTSTSYQHIHHHSSKPHKSKPSKHHHTHVHTSSSSHANAPQLTVGYPALSNDSQVAMAHYSDPNHFQYSRCTGRKKALCIGINYFGQPNQLSGCVNDAKNVKKFLMRHHHYRENDIVLLVDDSPNPREHPTKANILDAMHWLVRGACENDSLFLHYSGHGGQVKDRDGDEVDGYDEVIMPLDYRRAGVLIDDLMHTILVKSLPEGCRLTALFDSCHSGSALDLPYLYHTNGRIKGSQVKPKHVRLKATNADVISWSGCKDSQTSADTVEDGLATGAMSYAFMSSLRRNPNQTYQELLISIREILRQKYSQKPQLSSSHKIDTGVKFIM